MFLDAPRTELSQGDIFDDVSVVDLGGDLEGQRQIQAIILSNSCDIQPGQKMRQQHLLVAEVRPSGEAQDHGLWGKIVEGKAWNASYLPAGANHGESFIDFNRVYRVERASFFGDDGSPRERVASSTNDAQRVLALRFLSYLLHEPLVKPPEV